jgi:diadenosine tetraphosphatase ApaH/serine/threonine PP2A family protein phosphatase
MLPIELQPGESYVADATVDKLWVNVGSVGQPRDGDNRSSFMTWDTEERRLEYIRIPYDYETTMSKIRKIPELDNFLADRLEKGQ